MHTIELAPRGDCIHITVTGDLDPTKALQIVEAAHAIGLRHDVHRYLMDVRAARNIASPIDNFYFTHEDVLSLEELDTRARIALLVAIDDHSHDFIEVLSINTGHNLRIFRDLDEALAFLQVEKER